MTENKKIILSFVVAIGVFSFSCKKDAGINPSLDYRTPFAGNYAAHIKKTTYSMGQLVSDTVYTQSISVTVDYSYPDKKSITVNNEFFSGLAYYSVGYKAFNTTSQFNNSTVTFCNDSLTYIVVKGSNGASIEYTYKAKKIN